MSNDHPRPNDDECEVDEQLPVDARVMKVLFDAGPLGPMVRIVVMSEQKTTSYLPLKEYHHNETALSVEHVDSFTMRCDRINEATDEAIDEFVAHMPQQFVTHQAPVWRQGVRSSSAARKRLYKAADPDDTTRYIGVLVEQDEGGNLQYITWYKTSDSGSIFGTTPGTLDFQLVQDGSGAPSTNPNDIGGWTWYYTTSQETCA